MSHTRIVIIVPLKYRCGKDILRMKGVLCIDRSGTQFIVNGIGTDIAGHVARQCWDTSSSPQSFLVLIGKQLQRHVNDLEKEFDKLVCE